MNNFGKSFDHLKKACLDHLHFNLVTISPSRLITKIVYNIDKLKINPTRIVWTSSTLRTTSSGTSRTCWRRCATSSSSSSSSASCQSSTASSCVSATPTFVANKSEFAKNRETQMWKAGKMITGPCEKIYWHFKLIFE